MPYSMIRSLSWMQSACTPPSQDEGPWCFDLRDDCWHCCCSSQGEGAACDQQHSYLSEVDQNTAQASDMDDTLTRCLDLADSGN